MYPIDRRSSIAPLASPARAVQVGLALCVLLLGPSCSRQPADPVAALLSELEAAAEARDGDRFAERLSATFRGEDGSAKPETLRELKRYFAAYQTISIELVGVECTRSADEAEVRFVAEFSGRARPLPGLEGFLPPSAAYRFTLGVANEDGTWRVRSARWNRVEPDAQGIR